MAIEKNSIPYAKALFSLAIDKKNTAAIKADAQTLKSLAQNHTEFKDLISNPTVSNQTKSNIIKNTFAGKIQPETLNFLFLLIKKGRLGQLGSICETIIQLVNPELVGGFVLEFDNKILDNSISTQLQTLKNNLIN